MFECWRGQCTPQPRRKSRALTEGHAESPLHRGRGPDRRRQDEPFRVVGRAVAGQEVAGGSGGEPISLSVLHRYASLRLSDTALFPPEPVPPTTGTGSVRPFQTVAGERLSL